MRRNILFNIILFLFIFSTGTFAQKLDFGPDIGFNIVPIQKSTTDGHIYKLGFNGGAFALYPINNKLSIKFGFNVSTSYKSYTKTDTSSIDKSIIAAMASGVSDTTINSLPTNLVDLSVNKTTKSNTSFIYLKIPITADFKLNSKFSFSVGGYFALMMSAKTKQEINIDVPIIKVLEPALDSIPFSKQIISAMYPGVFEPDIKETSSVKGFNTYDAGIVVALKYKMENNFFFSANFTKGLVNYYKVLPEMYEVNSGKQNYLTLSIGYTFGNNLESKDKRRYDIPQE